MSYSEEFKNDDILHIKIFGTNNTGTISKIKYNSQQQNPFLRNANEYQLYIEKFSVPGGSLPIHVVEIQENQNNPNLTKMSITLEYGIQIVQAFLIYTPANDIDVPNASNNYSGENNLLYYSIYNYQDIIEMVNNALLEAFNLLTGLPVGVSAAPYVQFDPLTKLFDITAQQSFYINSVKVYMNGLLQNLFDGLQSKQITKEGNRTLGRDYEIIIKFRDSNSIVIPVGMRGNPSNGYLMISEYSCLQNWNTPRQIVIRSSLGVLGTTSISESNINGLPVNENLLTDFSISDLDASTKNVINYVPSKYRMFELTKKGDMNDISIDCGWTDRHGNYYPLFMNNGESYDITLAFKRKPVHHHRNYDKK